MTSSFGPWATAMSAGRSPHLSSFWRERLVRLPALRPHTRPSRLAVGAALVVALLVLALPLVGVAPMAIGGDSEAPQAPLELRTRADRAKAGGNAASEAAVERGLAWLAAQQKDDGHWELEASAGNYKLTPAATTFGVLPFLGAGVKPGGRHRYSKNVDLALDYLIAQQKEDGDFSGYCYARALATLTLCEAYGLQPQERYRKAAQKGVDYIVKAQCKDGSWSYQHPQDRGDTSNVGWQLQALYAAKVVGLKVPDEVWTKADKYLDAAASPGGDGYSYIAGAGHPTLTMTASGLNSRFLIGAKKPAKKDVLAGLSLKETVPGPPHLDFYFLYYALQAAHRAGAEEWTAKVRDMLVGLQIHDGDHKGSWDPQTDIIGRATGRLGTTCLALLSLEVYYRYP
ncbi:MAG: prenyltransferase/squalene oxidase repeat-containing protein [Gemmataceae bacterium]